MGVSSEQSSNNMNRFVVACAFVACVSGAPQYLNHGVSTVGHASYAGPAQHVGVSHGATVASAPVVTGQTHQTYAAGPPVVEQHTEYGVVGSQVVQTGHASVIGGYTHVPAGQEVIPQPATSYVAGAPQTLTETRPLAPPVIPHAAPYVAAIPPAPVPAGPAPADTVVQQKILAPVRTHTRITPQQTNIIPKVEVQNYNVDVPVHVPVPVERTVLLTSTSLSLTRSLYPVPFPCLPLTRCTPSRRSWRLPMCTTPPTPPTTSSQLSPLTPPQSTRPSTFPCTLSRPTLSTVLPTLRPQLSPTWPPLPLPTSPTATLPDMWLPPTKL